MIAASAALSTSVTKSFARFDFTSRPPLSSEARLMIEPARRAARTAIVSMGCMGGAILDLRHGPNPHRPLPARPPGQHRVGGARDAEHGHYRPAPGRAGA